MSLPAQSDSLLTWARYYVSCGISVFPIDPKTKRPLIDWGIFRTKIADDNQLVAWFASPNSQDVGIAMACGKISGNISVCDIDEPDFCDWLRANHPKVLTSTWTNESGGGKIHLICRTLQEEHTTAFNHPITKKRVYDIKAKDGYIILPPSGHPSGNFYRVLFGDPDAMLTVQDMATIGWRLYSEWSKPFDARNTPTNNMDIADPVLDPLLEDDLRKHVQTLGRKYRDAVFQLDGWALQYDIPYGATGSDSQRSEVQFSILGAMFTRSWTYEQARDAFATYACGDLCYRRLDRPHHGESLLKHDWDKISAARDQTTSSAADCNGLNFHLLWAHKLDYGEEPRYELRLLALETLKERSLLVPYEIICTERRLLQEISARLDIYAELPPATRGKNFSHFLVCFMHLLEDEVVPEEAKAQGHIRAMVVSALSRSGVLKDLPNGPDGSREFRVAWVQDGDIYLRGHTLVYEIGGMTFPRPSMTSVWEALRDIGAQTINYRYKKGMRENLWMLPQANLFPGEVADAD